MFFDRWIVWITSSIVDCLFFSVRIYGNTSESARIYRHCSFLDLVSFRIIIFRKNWNIYKKVVVCFWIYPRLGLNVCLSPWIHQCDFVIIKWLDVFRDDESADDDEVAVVRGVVGSERKWSLVIFRSVSMYVCTSSTYHQFYLY